MTRDEIEQQRALLKVYFPNQSAERAMFNTLCDMAVKHLKCVPPEAADTKDAERWRTHVRLLRAKHPPVVVEQLLKAVDEHLPQKK
jgi:hypothetical protein